MTQTDREIKRQLPAVLPPEPPQRFLSLGHTQEQWDVLTKTFYPSAKKRRIDHARRELLQSS